MRKAKKENTLIQKVNSVIKINFKENKDAITGILIRVGKKWLLLRHNPVDFVLDGYVFVLRKNVAEIVVSEREEFHKQVILSKKRTLKKDKSFDLNLDIADNVFNYFEKKESVQIEGPSNDILYIGKIIKNEIRSITFHPLDKRANWLNERKILKSNIWCLYYKNDYISSLCSFEKVQRKKTNIDM
jgi:hypothetical protein